MNDKISIEKSLLEQTGNLLEALLLTYFKNIDCSEAKTLDSIITELSLPISKATLSRAINRLEKQGFIATKKDRFTNKTYFNYTLKSRKSQEYKALSDYKGVENSVVEVSEVQGSNDKLEIRQVIEEQLEYNILYQNYGDKMNSIVELITEVFSSNKKFIRVNSASVHNTVVKSRLKQLKAYHIDAVMDKFKSQYKRILNTKSYLLTMLFNVVVEESFDIENLYNADEYTRTKQERIERLQLKEQEYNQLIGNMLIAGDLDGLERIGYFIDTSTERVLSLASENQALKNKLEYIKNQTSKTYNVLNAQG